MTQSRSWSSPIPAYMMSGSVSEMAIAPLGRVRQHSAAARADVGSDIAPFEGLDLFRAGRLGRGCDEDGPKHCETQDENEQCFGFHLEPLLYQTF